TWMVGVEKLVHDPPPDEQRKIAEAYDKLRRQLSDPEENATWLRWSRKSRFIQKCRVGDSIIGIWRLSRAKQPTYVSCAAAVLLKQHSKNWTRFYLGPPRGTYPELSWRKFRRLLEQVGYSGHIGPYIEQLIDPETSDTIERRWKVTARQ